jgi:DNA-binding NtrC family response regulator
LVLLDLRLPDIEGSEVLKEIKKVDIDLPVIMLTGYGTIDSAVEAMKWGAYDYVEKPPDLTELKLTVARALESRALRQEVERLRSQRAQEFSWIVGQSSQMRRVAELVEKVAPSRATIIIQGESGTGKEVIAQAIHRQSDRALKPFMAINCAAIPEALLESELFGHEAGAFTDAKGRKKGLFEVADGGTLFLDEISGMRLEMQAKLLRVLETNVLRRVGGTQDIKVDLRIISATNRDLKGMIREGGFREDLFYRLSVVVIDVPPLRERAKDIDLFVVAFLAEFSEAMGKKVRGVSEEALRYLRAYPWPGNVRELRNVMERAVILCDGEEIEPAHLPAEIVESGRAARPVMASLEVPLGEEGIDLKGTMEAFERRMIEEALRRSGGNQSQAARLLGISRDMLRYSLQKYGLSS